MVSGKANGRERQIVTSDLGFEVQPETGEWHPVDASHARPQNIGLLGGNSLKGLTGKGVVFDGANFAVGIAKAGEGVEAF